MTKENLIKLYNSLFQLQYLRGAKFSYAVAKNIDLMKPEIDALNKAVEKSEAYITLEKEFEPERVVIAEKYANKDKEGKAITRKVINNGQEAEIYDMTPENQQKSNQECEDAMKIKNPATYQERLNQIEEYNKLLKEEYVNAFFPWPLKIEDLPAEISAGQTTSIFAIIKDS